MNRSRKKGRSRLEPIIHFVAPFAALIAAGVKPRKSFLLALLGLAPDLDAALLIHRSFTHSIIVIFLAIIPLMVVAYRIGRGLSTCMQALFVLISHAIFDFVTDYTPILWPLDTRGYWLHMAFMVHVSGSAKTALYVNLLTEPSTFSNFQSMDAPLFTGEGLIISAVLVFPVLLKLLKPYFTKNRV